MRKIIAICFMLFLCIFGTARAQEYLDRQELLKQLSVAAEDTNRVLLYISLGQQYENNQPDTAIYYYLKARALSEELGYVTGTLKYLSNITYVLNAQSKFDSALQLNLKSVELAKAHGSPVQLAACLGNVANSYLYLEMYENAIDYFLQASELIGKSGNKQYQVVLFNNLAIIYNKLKQPGKARNYAEKAVSLARETNDLYNLGISLDNLALTHISEGNLPTAITCLEEALKIAEETENIYTKESILINLADAYRKSGKFIQIKLFAEEGAKLAADLEDVSGEATANLSLGYYYLYESNLSEALSYARQSEVKAASLNLLEPLANAYSLLGLIALAKKQYVGFQRYQFKDDSIINLTVNERILKNIQDLEAKYETEKKVQQIKQLEQDRAIQELKLAHNRYILIILGGIIFSILAVAILLIAGYRQKQQILHQEKELQDNRIKELETEKLLAAAEAALKGQDDERTRLARDLHDGLGGMLSGIKLSFMSLKELLRENSEDSHKFDRSIDMLDGSIVELRRVAHNLMPETLLKFGLDTALSDYCERINSSGFLHMSYQSINLRNLKADQTVQITIYRIVQEMINNVVNHASASNVFVQLANHDNQLSISVEDDGVGFDVETIHHSPGIGWNNILSRVDYLKGRIDIRSSTNKGTTINIELDI